MQSLTGMMAWMSLLVTLLPLLALTTSIQHSSNFNRSKINEVVSSDPISLPIILSPSSHRIVALPFQNPPQAPGFGEEDTESYRLRRYQLKDTKYKPQDRSLSELESNILYNMEPPSSLFDVSRTITIEDYQLLEVKSIKVTLINPTDQFRFCINQIYADSQAVKRIEQRKLPFCLNPNNKYPFFFNFYVTQQKPIIFRTSLYFIISIYDGEELVDEKIWPREIIAKVSQNHLKMTPVEARNCGNPKNFTTLTILNPHPHSIKVSFDSQYEGQQKNAQKQVMIPSQKNFKMSITSKQSVIGISTRPSEGSISDNRLPKLYLPVFCVKPLEINHFNIGVLNTERSLVEILVPVSSNAKQNIEIKSVEVTSSTKTIEVLRVENDNRIGPGQQHVGLCQLIAHVPSQPTEKTNIQVRVQYFLESNPKQILVTKHHFKFYELRNPLSLQGRRFFDLTKVTESDSVMDSIFPIRNNLNLPLLLVRVIFDEKVFKLTWLKDRREFIYPNQKRDEFSLQYIGPRELKISPAKYIMMLQFNGNLFIPIELVVYDHTLQCVYNGLQQKCQNLGPIDFGYFRTNATKFKQLIIRNWNPIQKEIKLTLIERLVQSFGMNCTMSIFGPFPNYDIATLSVNNSLSFYLKGNHFVIINIAIGPLNNATSGEASFQLQTENEVIMKKIRFKVENGTIALIPQVLRISSVYEQTVQYLNLVSTFSEPYKIRATYVNNSNINIFFNNHSEIYENQWIGLALVYDPFPQPVATQPSSSYVASQSTAGVVPKASQNCCGNEYFVNSFVSSLYLNDYRRFTYVSVRVVTTTELEATSTIIIDNTPPKLIGEDNFSISLINYNQHSHLQHNDKTSKHYKIKVVNVFKEHLKFRAAMIPPSLYEDTRQYVASMKKSRRVYEDALLCVNNAIAVKHNFSPQMIKALLALDSIPQELTIQPLENGEYYVGGSVRSGPLGSSSPELTEYVRTTVAGGARVCYKMNVTRYVKELIESHVLNDIAESYSSELLHQFVQKEMQNFNSFLHYLEYDDFYDSLDYNFDHYCRKIAYPFFRFCKQIGVAVFPNTEVVLQPGEETQITIKTVSKFKESSANFYLAILNNITKHEVHLMNINITQPKLKIKKLYGSSLKHITKKDLSRLLKLKESQISDADPGLKKFLSQSVPIFLKSIDHAGNQTQTFTISNPSTIDINITHVGFDSVERSCSYRGFEIAKDLCNGFVVKSGEQMNITLGLTKAATKMRNIKNVGLYLYHGDTFFLRVNLIVKGQEGDGSSVEMAVYTFCLNIVSFVFMMVVIWKLKKQIDLKEQLRKNNMKVKIGNVSNYGKLGTRIEKKGRKLQPIPQEQISAVKQIQEKRLKQFFNSSGESEIAKRQHTEEEQPSKIEILNVLKQDKSNISVSEESSIDFIDLNALNRSTHNMEEQEQEGRENDDNRTIENEEHDDNENQQQNDGQGEERGKNEWETGSQGGRSDADSIFTEGDVIDYPIVKGDYGWGDPTQERKKQEEGNSYYNVFYSQNPLKKKESGLFLWMNDFHR